MVTLVATSTESGLDDKPTVPDFKTDANRTIFIDKRVYNKASLITNQLNINEKQLLDGFNTRGTSQRLTVPDDHLEATFDLGKHSS